MMREYDAEESVLLVRKGICPRGCGSRLVKYDHSNDSAMLHPAWTFPDVTQICMECHFGFGIFIDQGTAKLRTCHPNDYWLKMSPTTKNEHFIASGPGKDLDFTKILKSS